jgi:hypothetical protein
MLSGRPGGEGVEVVGEDRPAGPRPHPVVALEPRAAQAVAAFEVADAALGAGAVAGSALCGCAVSRPRGVRRVGSARRRGRGTPPWSDRAGSRRRRRSPGSDPGPVELGGGVRQEPVLGRVARRVAGRQDEPARALAGVLVTSQICATYPNSVGLPSLPFGSAERRVRDRDQAIVIFGPRARRSICSATFWQRVASCSSWFAARSLACAAATRLRATERRAVASPSRSGPRSDRPAR